MPMAIIDGPQIDDLNLKRTLVKEITDALEKAYGLQRESYIVIIRESLPENVAVAGELILDRIRK
ncbi:MAG: tautomerase family protein, partial [Theionarchaea archaeon]|nr:tautomerase family protein [Theionarchaea archaeon]